jgi:glycosyltransferase involved in cell wall biosynthesis
VKTTYFSKYSERGPSSRYRIYQFLDLFKSSGVEVSLSPLFEDFYFEILTEPEPAQIVKKTAYTSTRFRKRRQDLKNHHGDLIVIEQQLFPYMPFSVEKKYLPSVYLLEFDDAIYLTHPKKMPELIRNARAVITGNRTLAEFAGELNPNVHVVPTVLNTEAFHPSPKEPREKLILGWTGLEYNFKYLKIVASVLRKLVEKYPLEIVILSGSPPKDFDVPFRFLKWDREREVQQINEFDIGIMPLEIDEWCKGKCGFKLLQYMALEIPAVATPVGVNRQIIHHQKNGFLAEQMEEWETHLSSLVENADLRKRIGEAGRSTVLEHYSTSAWFPTLLAVYRRYSGQ